MSKSLRLHPSAKKELASAARWYHRRRAGLGDKFVLAVEETTARVRATPQAFQIVYRNVRRAVVRGFPYTVFFAELPKHILIISVFHAKQDPKKWQARVDELDPP